MLWGVLFLWSPLLTLLSHADGTCPRSTAECLPARLLPLRPWLDSPGVQRAGPTSPQVRAHMGQALAHRSHLHIAVAHHVPAWLTRLHLPPHPHPRAVLKKFQQHLQSGSKLELLSLRELEDLDEATARLLYNAGESGAQQLANELCDTSNQDLPLPSVHRSSCLLLQLQPAL